MQHTIEQLIDKINVMHDKAIELHRLRNQNSELSDKKYDKTMCQLIIDQIQQMALEIAYDREGNEIKTEMEYKND